MENWTNDDDYSHPIGSSFEGRSYGRGRGFSPTDNNENDGWEENSLTSDFEDGRFNKNGGRGGSRGGGLGSRGNGGRGKRGGRGGFRSHNDDGDDYGYRNDNENGDRFDDDQENDGGFMGGKGSRGGGRGGSRNYRKEDNGFKDDGFDSNDFNDRGGRGSRGGRGGGRGRGRGGGGGNRNNDSDKEGDGNTKPKTEIYIPPEISTDEKSLFENGVEQGINFDKYDEIDVCVSGENVPPMIESFEEAGLRKHILTNILKSKYTKPTPVQKYALPIIMSGRDLMACAQTGSGKTAAFVVPIVNTLLEYPREVSSTSSHCEPQVIIISPTRELTIQIYEQVLKFSAGTILKSVVAYGGTSVMHQANRISAGCDIIVATPGRLLDFLQRGRITLSAIRFLVLDEADRMLDMGFLSDVEKIVNHETMVPTGERQTLMFSATFPDEVQRLALRFLKDYLFVAVGIVGGACSDVEQKFYEVSKYKKREMLKELMEKETAAGTQQGTLVFVEMKRTADFIAAFLSENNYPTTSIHGDRLQREREEALRDFRIGKMSILVATAVAARGLDIRNVAHVVNYDMPKGIDEYVHRIGRTGRVGNRGRATSFFDRDSDMPLVADLVKILKQANQPVPDWLIHGGDNRAFAPGRARKFGGEDIRNFEDESSGVPYGDDAYNIAIEPEEQW